MGVFKMLNLQCKKKGNIGQRIITEHLVLYPLTDWKTWVFNLSAAEVWEVLDLHTDFDELCAEIAHRNRCNVEQVAEPVEAFLRILSQCNLVELFENGKLIVDQKRTTSMEKEFESLCIQEKVLLTVLLETTYQCNLLCRHCYLCEHFDGMPLEKIEEILHQLRDLHVVDLTISGGEIFLRDDIFDILRTAARLGFRTTIISNGTLITDRIIEELATIPLFFIKLSIYSLNPQIHDMITCVKGSHEKAMNAFHQLLQSGQRVSVGAIIQKENARDIPALKEYVEQHGAYFFGDYKIFPDHEGNEEPLDYYVEEETLTDLLKSRTITPIQEISCQAATIKAKIDPAGNVYPCELLQIPLGNLHEQSFPTIWSSSKTLAVRERVQNYNPPECEHCTNKANCVRCPAYVWTDGKYPNIHHDIMCYTARCHQKSVKEVSLDAD